MSEVVWPMGMDRDLSDRPLVFDPKGFLVALLEDDAACERARAALVAAGFAEDGLRVYTSRQILDDHEVYLAARSKTRRVAAAVTDDKELIELYFGAAREGKAALWVVAPGRHDASRAMRVLVDHGVLLYHYFGPNRQETVHVGRASS